MFIHIRECEEIEKCKNITNAKTLLVTNKNVLTITTKELKQTAKMFVEKLFY